jgi:hypothetical protein
MTTTRAIFTLTSLALVATACGASGANTESGNANADGAKSAASAEYVSPLGDLLGYNTDYDSEEAQAEQAQSNRESEEKVAACMRAEGFEYTPSSNDQFQSFLVEDELGYGTAEWVAKFGFGISTQAFSQSAVGPNLVGSTDEGFDLDDDTTTTDPNQTYVETLSDAEQTAYYATLYGNSSGPEWDSSLSDEENEAVQEDFYNKDTELTGCANIAFQDSSGGDSFETATAVFEKFGDELEELQQRIEADPKIVGLRADLKACVLKKGFDYTDQETAFNDLDSRMSGIGEQDSEQAEVDYGSLTDEQVDALFTAQEALSDADKEKLAEVQKYELELAAVVSECSGGSLDISGSATYTEVRVRLEQEFLDTNSDALAEITGSGG